MDSEEITFKYFGNAFKDSWDIKWIKFYSFQLTI